MRIRQTIEMLLKVALVGAGIYVIINWDSVKPSGDDASDFAESACIDEINDRFEISRASAYEVTRTDNGYTVRVSVTLASGTPAKVICLANSHGGIDDVSIDVR